MNEPYKTLLSSKLHNLTVNKCNPDYIGSITLDPIWMNKVRLNEFEQVHVWSYAGPRIITYAMAGAPGQKECQLNGSAATHFSVGDKIIVSAFQNFPLNTARKHKPYILVFNNENNIKDDYGWETRHYTEIP